MVLLPIQSFFALSLCAVACVDILFSFPPGGKVSVAVPMYKPSGQSANAEESAFFPVAPGGLSVSAEGAAP